LSAGLAAAVDDLYRDIVMEPERWNEDDFAGWIEALTTDTGSIDRGQAKQLRRAIRNAIKLQSFWSSADADQRAELLWKARVDIAIGVPAWRPPLELAMRDLEANPSEEAFEDVRERFRVVHGDVWLEGISFGEWNERESSIGDAQ